MTKGGPFSFHLSGHTLGFHPQSQKLEPQNHAVQQSEHYCRKVLHNSFCLNGHT